MRETKAFWLGLAAFCFICAIRGIYGGREFASFTLAALTGFYVYLAMRP